MHILLSLFLYVQANDWWFNFSKWSPIATLDNRVP